MTNKNESKTIERAGTPAVAVQRGVRWLAALVDSQPDWLKAALLIVIMIRGAFLMVEMFIGLMWLIVYLAVKAI